MSTKTFTTFTLTVRNGLPAVTGLLVADGSILESKYAEIAATALLCATKNCTDMTNKSACMKSGIRFDRNDNSKPVGYSEGRYALSFIFGNEEAAKEFYTTIKSK
jgi:hypothetical protein